LYVCPPEALLLNPGTFAASHPSKEDRTEAKGSVAFIDVHGGGPPDGKSAEYTPLAPGRSELFPPVVTTNLPLSAKLGESIMAMPRLLT
jgi:hypothetical protein